MSPQRDGDGGVSGIHGEVSLRREARCVSTNVHTKENTPRSTDAIHRSTVTPLPGASKR